jgi:4-amino-4-deoxy-L-arabinose transferase-like glycosyltransferase
MPTESPRPPSPWAILLARPGSGWPWPCALFDWRAWARWREGDDAARYLLPLVWVLAVALLTDLPAGGSPAWLGVIYPAGLVAMAIGLDRLWAWIEQPRPAGAIRAPGLGVCSGWGSSP